MSVGLFSFPQAGGGWADEDIGPYGGSLAGGGLAPGGGAGAQGLPMLPGQAAGKDDWETAIKEAVDEGPGEPVGIDITGKSGRIIDRDTEGAGKKAGIPKIQVDEILKTPKFSRPDPATYLKEEYITRHTTQFKGGVTKISYQAPSGYAGPPGGTFVMPTSVADDLIARAGGDISELERLFGLEPGELGTNPVRIDIANPSGLRMPSGMDSWRLY